MKRTSILFGIAVIAAFCAVTGSAHAQATRTWVSGVGDDANPCSRTAPCKTWAGAISKTAAGGEIDALDPGGFGTLTITKAITIDGGGGVVASTLASGTVGFTVNAGASDNVTIRNLRINGVGQYVSPGTTGINVINCGNLTVENDVIEGFTQGGINFAPSNAGSLDVFNSTIQFNAAGGIFVSTAAVSGGVARAVISNSRITNNNNGSSAVPATSGTGVLAGNHARVDIINSVLERNYESAISDGADARMSLSNSDLSNNLFSAIHVRNSGHLVMGGLSVFSNGTWAIFVETGGVVTSYGNNVVTGNGLPTTTVAPI